MRLCLENLSGKLRSHIPPILRHNARNQEVLPVRIFARLSWLCIYHIIKLLSVIHFVTGDNG